MNTYVKVFTPSKPKHFATNNLQLSKLHINSGRFTVPAARDDQNRVYWVLPGCNVTYDRNRALRAAAAGGEILGGY